MISNFKLDISRVPRELKLIFKMIKNDYISEGWFRDIDWNEFYNQALHHRVFPLLYPILISKYKKNIPEKLLDKIGSRYRSNVLQMLHLTSQMEKLAKLFAENNVPLIFLKGPVLAKELYQDISLRTCADLDALIHIQDVERIDIILQEQGFKKNDYIQTVLNDWKWRHHHVTYFHPKKNLKFEVHWRLHPGPGIEPRFKELWQRKRVCYFSKSPVYYLGREDLFLFLVSHGARHGWSRIRWLVDIHYSLFQSEEMENLPILSKQHNNSHLVSQALILSNQLFGTEISKVYSKKFNMEKSSKLAQQAIFYLERMVNLHTDPVPKDIFQYHSRHLYSLMSFQQKILYILSTLHPYPEDAQTLPLPKNLHFLYFILRPFLWLWRKTRKLALS
ncbi:nucleotidyltransferase family protein [Bacillus sp. 1P10SD]|uniref:nucleotidyltransferase domain-containing protein n=1 Tax=Bacillus sp. 1P10SD TaxID=3132265 RepID=UPI0039A56833